MSDTIIEKKEELIDAIKHSNEYQEYLEARETLTRYPDQREELEEYKKLLLESQLSQFLGDAPSPSEVEEMDQIYDEISKSDAVNNYLNAEYRLKNLIHGIYQDLSFIIENKDGRGTFFL